MHVHILQHVPFEDIGSMAPWLSQRGAVLTYTRFHEAGATLPDPSDSLGLLIAMGGPMSVNDEAQFPWLEAEKRFIRDTVSRQTPFIGICLGAQLLASAFGAKIYPNGEREIGWFPVRATTPAGDAFRFPEEATVFHWHGETFDLPEGGVRLAESEACRNQAFQLGRRAIGLQFHLETTRESLGAIVEACGSELTDAPFVQSEETLLATPESRYTAVNRLMAHILTYVTGETGAAS